MAKNAVSDWDTTAANNTDIGGISIAEGCAMANLNNGMREIMAQIKTLSSTLALVSSSAQLGVADQVITGGTRVTPDTSLGTVTTGTVTPDPGDRPLQSYTNGGAHTLAPGSNNGYYLLDITNNVSAGAITTSGWTKVVGSFTTTNGHKFRCGCSISTAGSLLTIQALQ